MASNEKVRIQKVYSDAAVYLKSHGLRTGARTRENLAQMIETLTGKTCVGDQDRYVDDYVQSQKRSTVATVKPPRPFKTYVPPRNMRLVAAKVADQPVPMSMSSSVIHKFFPS